jgi:hypothetical protein
MEDPLRMKKAFLCVILFAAAGALYSQTAEEMDILLETQVLTYGQAVSLSFAAVDILGDLPVEDAFALAQSRGWVPKDSGSMYPVKFDKAAFLLMQAFQLPGGLLYRLFPGPRYAYRELVYRGVFQGQPDPSLSLTGEEFINILGRLLDLAENSGAKNGEGSNNE